MNAPVNLLVLGYWAFLFTGAIASEAALSTGEDAIYDAYSQALRSMESSGPLVIGTWKDMPLEAPRDSEFFVVFDWSALNLEQILQVKVNVALKDPVWWQLNQLVEDYPSASSLELSQLVRYETINLNEDNCAALRGIWREWRISSLGIDLPEPSSERTMYLHPKLYILFVSGEDGDARLELKSHHPFAEKLEAALDEVRSCVARINT